MSQEDEDRALENIFFIWIYMDKTNDIPFKKEMLFILRNV